MKPNITGFALIPALVVADQLSKWWITEHVLRPAAALGEPVALGQWLAAAPEKLPAVTVPLLPVFDLSMVWNRGVSFGMLSSDHASGPLFLTVVSLLISVVFAFWLYKSTSKFEAAGLAMVIGGALGNIIDRARFGAVADFFHAFYGTWSFPAFNIADACITIGVIMVLIHGLFLSKDNGKETR